MNYCSNQAGRKKQKQAQQRNISNMDWVATCCYMELSEILLYVILDFKKITNNPWTYIHQRAQYNTVLVGKHHKNTRQHKV